MAVTITWTKEWSSSNDGEIFYGSDLENIQSNIESHSHTESASRYTTTFTNATLSSGDLTVTHNIGNKYIMCFIYDNSDIQVVPDTITLNSTTQCTVALDSYGTLTGTWRVVCF